MNRLECDGLRNRLELWLDAGLNAEETEAVESHLQSCASCRVVFEAHAELGMGLSSYFNGSPPQSLAARARTGPWLARVAAAASLMLALTLVAREFMTPRGGAAASQHLNFAANATVMPSSSQWLEGNLTENTELRFAPGAQGRILANQSGVRLLSGLLVVAGDHPEVLVEADGLGSLLVRGAASISRSALGGDDLLLVHLHSGTAELHQAGTQTPLEIGMPTLVLRGMVQRVDQMMRRFVDIQDDEGLMVLTSEEAFQLDQERDALQERVSQLLADNERLSLEHEVLRSRHRDSMTGMSLREMINVLAEAADAEPAGRSSRSSARRIGSVAWSARGHEGEAIALVKERLLNSQATIASRRVGIGLIGRLEGAEAIAVLEATVEDADPQIREVALEHLARKAEPRHTALLRQHFREDSPLPIRVYAAGGLVRLGDTGAPLDWLIATAESPELDATMRRRVLGRILQAPVDRIRDVFVRALNGSTLSLEQKKELIGVLHFSAGPRPGEVDGNSARSLLSALTLVVTDQELETLLRHGPRRQGPW